jgi:hypothetical protein
MGCSTHRRLTAHNLKTPCPMPMKDGQVRMSACDWHTRLEEAHQRTGACLARIRFPRHLAVALIGGVLVAAGGCQDATAPIAVAQLRVRPEWVTGAAAAAVDSTTGLIRIATPPGQSIERLAADSIALAVLHGVLTPNPLNMAPSLLEKDRGGPIDFAHLHLCGGATYAWAPFASFPSSVPPFLQRAWSSHWALPVCGADGSAQVSIGVADSPRGYVVVADTFYRPADYLDALNQATEVTGVPARFPSGLPLTPEEAIRAVYIATGERVATIPVAFNQITDGFGELPLCASWRMSVEAPVTVKGEATGAVWITAEFFVHHIPACFSDSIAVDAALPNQPASMWLMISMAGDSASAPLGGPVQFDRVVVIR